jgi:3,4-dihydroxy 2-butanone 4-phosphate synthase/GTP cyclohydrolase II
MTELATRTLRQDLSPAEELIEEARNGRMFILVDDEDRENEGDLVIPAECASPLAIAFMACHARGLICLALTRARAEQLGLRPMGETNGGCHGTAFTVSIEAATGVSTGISAHDRARTIAVAVDEACGPADIVTPGHVFPLVAREGGTLVRAGHTEAAVDVARVAGRSPAGVICEIMNDDGTMARLPDLVRFARQHDLRIGTIADLIAYRRRTERLVRTVESGVLTHDIGGDWRVAVYADTVEYQEHLVLMKGDLAGPGPVMVRMHGVDVIDDVVGGHGGATLQDAMAMIAHEGRGVAVLLRDVRSTKLSTKVRSLKGAARPVGELRDYGIGAQILIDLGVSEMILLSNTPRTIVGLEGYGLSVAEQRVIEPRS